MDRYYVRLHQSDVLYRGVYLANDHDNIRCGRRKSYYTVVTSSGCRGRRPARVLGVELIKEYKYDTMSHKVNTRISTVRTRGVTRVLCIYYIILLSASYQKRLALVHYTHATPTHNIMCAQDTARNTYRYYTTC